MLFITQTLLLLLTLLILCMPLLIWLYVYQTMTSEFVRRRYILFGIALWALVTLPIVFHELFFVQLFLERVFSSLYIGNIVSMLFWLSLLIIILHIVFFLISSIFLSLVQNISSISFYVRSIFVMIGASILFFWVYFFLSRLPFSHIPLTDGGQVMFNIVYSSVLGIVWYYLIISCLEEYSKYIAHLTQSHRSDYRNSLSRFILFSLSLALGFSFFENILYVWMMYRNTGVSWTLVELAFFRSLFSLSLHLLCSLLFSLGMWYFWKYIQTKNPLFFIKRGYIFLLLGSIFFHAFFNLSLNFGYIAVVLLSVFGLYALIAYIVPRSLSENVQ